MGQHLRTRRIAVVVFVTLMTILGALAIPSGGGVGYVAYQHTVDNGLGVRASAGQALRWR
jgi:hypothetical protein